MCELAAREIKDFLESLQVSSKQLRDDLMTMLIAGHETSAAVLTWTFYLLSKVIQRLVLPEKGANSPLL